METMSTLVGNPADEPRRRPTRRSGQSSPSDASVAEVPYRSESGTGGARVSGWPSQPGPRYSPRGSQDQPERKELSSPRSQGSRREKHGEMGPADDPGGADHPRAKRQNHRFAAPRRTPTPTGSRQTPAVLGPDPGAPPDGAPCTTPGSSTPRRQGKLDDDTDPVCSTMGFRRRRRHRRCSTGGATAGGGRRRRRRQARTEWWRGHGAGGPACAPVRAFKEARPADAPAGRAPWGARVAAARGRGRQQPTGRHAAVAARCARNCKTSGLSRHVEPYFQHFTHFKHHFPRGTLPS